MNLLHLKSHFRHCQAIHPEILALKIPPLLCTACVHEQILIGLCCNGQTCSSLTGKTSGLPKFELGRYWQESGQWGKALDCYLRGLEIDDLAEEFYQGLMACYLNLGQKAKALSIYNRCKRILSSTLGIEPSPKTHAIYRSIIMNRRNGDSENG